MAINKVGVLTTGPVNADWQNLVKHVLAYNAQINNGGVNVIKSDGKIAMGSYIQFGGVLYQVQDEDYTVTGSAPASGATAYVRVQTDGDTLEASWGYTITSYVWNTTYNYYVSGTYALLPYRVYYDGSAYTVQKWDKHSITHDSVDINLPIAVTAGDWKTINSVSNITGSIGYVSESLTGLKSVTGTATIKLKGTSTSGYTMYGYVQKNGTTIISEHSTSSTDTIDLASVNTSIEEGDIFTLYVKSSSNETLAIATGICEISISKPTGVLNQLYAVTDLE